MAGRKDKNTVEYFPHYCNSGKTLYILESKYGNDGYAVWFKTLELLGSTDNHFIDCRDAASWEFMLAKMSLSSDSLQQIYDTLANLGAINPELWSNKIIWSENFINNVADVYVRRKSKLYTYEDLCQHLFNLCQHKLPSEQIDDDTNTQSKVKYSIVKDTKEENELPEKTEPPPPPPEPRPPEPRPPKYDYENLLSIYHSLCPKMRKVQVMNEARKGYVNARIGEYGQEKVVEVLRLAGESGFLNGKNDRSWTADFEWIMRPTNFINIMEHKFNNNGFNTAADKIDPKRVNAMWDNQS